MKVKHSKLELKDLVILNLDYQFNTPKENIDVDKLMSTYNIDLDFMIIESLANEYKVFVKASINYNLKKPVYGYSIFIECGSAFKIDSEVSKDERNQLISNSALVMTLNFLRVSLVNITGSFPFGKYILPSIDVKDLLEQKAIVSKKISTPRKKKL
jgi:preprotein translocase subunit SecB